MPKIKWTPPPRPPRIRIEPPPEDFMPVSENRCETCVGMGVLYKGEAKTEIECWVCKGNGKALPIPNSPGDPFKTTDPFDVSGYMRQSKSVTNFLQQTVRDSSIPSNKKAE